MTPDIFLEMICNGVVYTYGANIRPISLETEEPLSLTYTTHLELLMRMPVEQTMDKSFIELLNWPHS